ncbi:MAG: hypothetical protein K2O85_03725 [Helicobacter sp.]|nr:hypothetical protein [Helicobacter sp.]
MLNNDCHTERNETSRIQNILSCLQSEILQPQKRLQNDNFTSLQVRIND